MTNGPSEARSPADPFKGSGIEPHHRKDFYPADHANTPAELAQRIRTYGWWQGPDDLLDALEAQAETGEAEKNERGKILELLEAAEADRDRLEDALNLALMHLEDKRAIAAVRAALAETEHTP